MKKKVVIEKVPSSKKKVVIEGLPKAQGGTTVDDIYYTPESRLSQAPSWYNWGKGYSETGIPTLPQTTGYKVELPKQDTYNINLGQVGKVSTKKPISNIDYLNYLSSITPQFIGGSKYLNRALGYATQLGKDVGAFATLAKGKFKTPIDFSKYPNYFTDYSGMQYGYPVTMGYYQGGGNVPYYQYPGGNPIVGGDVSRYEIPLENMEPQTSLLPTKSNLELLGEPNLQKLPGTDLLGDLKQEKQEGMSKGQSIGQGIALGAKMLSDTVGIGANATKEFLLIPGNKNLTNEHNKLMTEYTQQARVPASVKSATTPQSSQGENFLAADGMQIREIGGKGEPNVEVEGDEHIQLPNGFSQEIKGKKHSEGGIPMNLPSGTKIFSEKLKVPVKFLMELIQINPEYAFLKNISLPKSGNISYADLAKKFETKKYVDLLNSKDADPIQITTAQLMIQQNNAALKKLFTLQEQNKLSGVHGPQVQQNAEQELQESAQQEAQEQEPMMMHGGYHLPKAQAGKDFKPKNRKEFLDWYKSKKEEIKNLPYRWDRKADQPTFAKNLYSPLRDQIDSLVRPEDVTEEEYEKIYQELNQDLKNINNDINFYYGFGDIPSDYKPVFDEYFNSKYKVQPLTVQPINQQGFAPVTKVTENPRVKANYPAISYPQTTETGFKYGEPSDVDWLNWQRAIEESAANRWVHPITGKRTGFKVPVPGIDTDPFSASGYYGTTDPQKLVNMAYQEQSYDDALDTPEGRKALARMWDETGRTNVGKQLGIQLPKGKLSELNDQDLKDVLNRLRPAYIEGNLDYRKAGYITPKAIETVKKTEEEQQAADAMRGKAPLAPGQVKKGMGIPMNIGIGLPIPQMDVLAPIDYYKIDPNLVEAPIIQPYTYDIDRAIRAGITNATDLSGTGIANRLQALATGIGEKGQRYDIAAKQNALAKYESDVQNANMISQTDRINQAAYTDFVNKKLQALGAMGTQQGLREEGAKEYMAQAAKEANTLNAMQQAYFPGQYAQGTLGDVLQTSKYGGKVKKKVKIKPKLKK